MDYVNNMHKTYRPYWGPSLRQTQSLKSQNVFHIPVYAEASLTAQSLQTLSNLFIIPSHPIQQ